MINRIDTKVEPHVEFQFGASSKALKPRIHRPTLFQGPGCRTASTKAARNQNNAKDNRHGRKK